MLSYYMDFVVAVILFMILGLFFSPLIGGCFLLLLIFALLGGLLVFFSVNFIWFLLAGLVIYLSRIVVKYLRWQRLPDINQYLAKNPDCKLNVGVACYKCNSESLSNQGLFHQRGKWRFYTCSQCGSVLFRFVVL